MSTIKLKMVSTPLAFSLGVRRLPPIGEYLEILIEGGPMLFWPIVSDKWSGR